jgi:hypothetical protein
LIMLDPWCAVAGVFPKHFRRHSQKYRCLHM